VLAEIRHSERPFQLGSDIKHLTILDLPAATADEFPVLS